MPDSWAVGVGGAVFDAVFEMDQNLKSLTTAVKECAREISAKLCYHESMMNTYQTA
jgi:hypothetical protein